MGSVQLYRTAVTVNHMQYMGEIMKLQTWMLQHTLPQETARNEYIVYNAEMYDSQTLAKMKNGVFCDIRPCGSCKNRRFAFIIRVTRIGELKTTLAVTSNRASVASYG
jgi:hypothetical protein